MTQTLTTEHPPDICLLLRVHGEQRWLVSKVIPAVRQLEEPGAIAPEELDAALAFMEVLWLEAGLRATETDAAADALHASCSEAAFLAEKANRYHAAVRRLRQVVDRRVRAVIAARGRGRRGISPAVEPRPARAPRPLPAVRGREGPHRRVGPGRRPIA